jgi:hypothetical protein
MKYNDGTLIKDAVTIDEWNIKALVGEFKILVDKMIMGVGLTPQEILEHRKMIIKWEEDIY